MSHELNGKSKNQFRKTTTVLTFILFGGFSISVFLYLSSLYKEIIYKNFAEKSNFNIQYISQDYLPGVIKHNGTTFPGYFVELLKKREITYFVFTTLRTWFSSLVFSSSLSRELIRFSRSFTRSITD